MRIARSGRSWRVFDDSENEVYANSDYAKAKGVFDYLWAQARTLSAQIEQHEPTPTANKTRE